MNDLKQILPNDAIVSNDYIFFLKGWLSQWYKSDMIENGVKFVTCEQYMMYHKAKLFNDKETATAILNTNKPSEQKALGRSVKNFNEEIWNQHKRKIVYNGNYLKFTQNSELKYRLIKTNPYTLVEANKHDMIWGIGMFNDDSNLLKTELWGQNLLGKTLTELRNDLMKLI